MKIISGTLIIITAWLSLKHGWDGLHIDPEQGKMMTDIGLGKSGIIMLSMLSIIIGIAILFPQSFFIANVLNAGILLLIMAFSLRAGNLKITLTEIPFLLIPLVLAYLGHPLKR